MPEYTDYCTCFYEPSENKVYFYDEIKDRVINTLDAKDEVEAEKLMNAWVNNAPNGVICQRLE